MTKWWKKFVPGSATAKVEPVTSPASSLPETFSQGDISEEEDEAFFSDSFEETGIDTNIPAGAGPNVISMAAYRAKKAGLKRRGSA